MQISAVIITYNEEVNIARCLQSLQGIADEIVVVDSFSTDKTEEICAQFEVRFIHHKFEGHVEQKNWAWQQTKFEYILSLDADEALNETLKLSVLEVKNNPTSGMYKMNRLTNYCGTWIKHGSWYPDTKLRLAKKDSVVWAGDNPHDKLTPIKKEKPVHLRGDILHYSYYTIEQHIAQQEKFSTISSQAMYDRGKKAPLYKLILNPAASLIKDIIIRKGYMDGKSGFIVAKISAKSVYWKYKKLRDLWDEGDKGLNK